MELARWWIPTISNDAETGGICFHCYDPSRSQYEKFYVSERCTEFRCLLCEKFIDAKESEMEEFPESYWVILMRYKGDDQPNSPLMALIKAPDQVAAMLRFKKECEDADSYLSTASSIEVFQESKYIFVAS